MKTRNLLVLMFVMAFSFITVAVSNQEVLAQAQSQQDEPAEIVHPIPRVPIVVDGVKMKPEEITQFNGQPLYFILDEQAKSEGTVYIFTTIEGISEYAKTDSRQTKLAASSCNEPSIVYKGYSLTGSSLAPGPGAVYDFISNPWLAGWANTMSSVKTTTCNVYTKLYDGGSQLWLATNGQTNNLGIYGWDNRADKVSVDPTY